VLVPKLFRRTTRLHLEKKIRLDNAGFEGMDVCLCCVGGLSVMDTRIGCMSCESNLRASSRINIRFYWFSAVEHLALDIGGRCWTQRVNRKSTTQSLPPVQPCRLKRIEVTSFLIVENFTIPVSAHACRRHLCVGISCGSLQWYLQRSALCL
jgi:hypothetical protein